MSVFLKAEWKNLINITYAIEPSILKPYLPKGLTIDLIDGKAFVSLVAFEFNNVIVKGFKIPFHRNFPEINLRFYVNQNGKRGVVFIKEFVPKYFVALVAKKIYNEPYNAIAMKVNTVETEKELNIEHKFAINKNLFGISVSVEKKLDTPSITSMEHFLKEHDIGFGINRNGETISYEVQHPIWEIYKIKNHSVDVDFGKVYGDKWSFLNNSEPFNVNLAKGSEIVVCKLN